MTIDWIDNRDKSKPFMTMCHFKATHEPYDYPKRFSHLYRNDTIPVPKTFYDSGAEDTGRSIVGQSIDNLGKRYVYSTNNHLSIFETYPNFIVRTTTYCSDSSIFKLIY